VFDLQSNEPTITIESMMLEELKFKYHSVIAYFILMVSRAVIFVVTDGSIVDYYEYVTCASIMAGIMLVYKMFSRGGLDNSKVVFLNYFIPIVIMTSAIWHMAIMQAGHFESQEAWAFCQC
jgi:hypothetical protein